MSSSNPKHNKDKDGARRGVSGTTLSDFAAYVEQQQALRTKPTAASTTTTTTTTSGTGGAASTTATSTTAAPIDEFDELSIIDQLNLGDDSTHPRITKLKPLLLAPQDDRSADEELGKVIKKLIAEGMTEALFDVGVELDGEPMGLKREEYDGAMERVKRVVTSLGGKVSILLTKGLEKEEGAEGVPLAAAGAGTGKGGKTGGGAGGVASAGCTSKILIRLHTKSIEDLLEIRVAVVGNVDAGKSTLLGVLTKGTLDDGRGKLRVNLFRHKHEIESGRTSSVGMEILGFDSESNIVGTAVPGRKLTWEEVGKRSSKVISFSDLAGHEKYLRTTVFGLLGTSPDYVMLMVAANNGIVGMTREHLGVALALNVPVFVVITKIDICPPNILEQTVSQLTKIMKSASARKIPIFVKTREEVIHTATQFVSDRICPIFQVSNVTGEGLENVKTFLNVLPYHGKFDSEGPFEFHVNDCFSVPFVGTVVSGVVKSGAIHAGDTIMIGPDSLGYFTTTAIRSIERKRLPVSICTAGQSASFALKRIRRKEVRKGMVVLPKTDPPPLATREFVAEVLILSHATTIKPNYQAMLHVGPVSQTCTIVGIDREFVRSGDRATVAFRFYQRPEYVCVGDKMIFREGRTKGYGFIKALGWDPNSPMWLRGGAAAAAKEGEAAAGSGTGTGAVGDGRVDPAVAANAVAVQSVGGGKK